MSWRGWLGVVLLLAAVFSGWSAWKMRERAPESGETIARSDYVLRDFELVVLATDGSESVRLRAPELQRSRADESLDIVTPVFLMPDPDTPWQLTADRGWVSADGELARLEGNVAGDSQAGPPTTFRTGRLELLPGQDLARTDDGVTFARPGIMQTGVGFEANLKNQQYKLLSQVRTRYEPSRR